jgi:hypothetical protein
MITLKISSNFSLCRQFLSYLLFQMQSLLPFARGLIFSVWFGLQYGKTACRISNLFLFDFEDGVLRAIQHLGIACIFIIIAIGALFILHHYLNLFINYLSFLLVLMGRLLSNDCMLGCWNN